MSPGARRVAAALAATAAVLALAACGTGPASSASTTSAVVGATTVAARPSMRGDRYCEVLLVTVAGGRTTAEVYNSYPLNDCPEQEWAALDPHAIAAEQGVTAALLNGPRYWLMDRVDKTDAADRVQKDFGGIAMYREASVDLGSLTAGNHPYTPHQVDRSTVFTFDQGRTVYELTAPDGTRYVMQTWSQQVDPALQESDLAGLGSRLKLPAGWSYSSRTLRAPLQVVTTTTAAEVLQDDLGNSYSRETS